MPVVRLSRFLKQMGLRERPQQRCNYTIGMLRRLYGIRAHEVLVAKKVIEELPREDRRYRTYRLVEGRKLPDLEKFAVWQEEVYTKKVVEVIEEAHQELLTVTDALYHWLQAVPESTRESRPMEPIRDLYDDLSVACETFPPIPDSVRNSGIMVCHLPEMMYDNAAKPTHDWRMRKVVSSVTACVKVLENNLHLGGSVSFVFDLQEAIEPLRGRRVPPLSQLKRSS